MIFRKTTLSKEPESMLPKPTPSGMSQDDDLNQKDLIHEPKKHKLRQRDTY